MKKLRNPSPWWLEYSASGLHKFLASLPVQLSRERSFKLHLAQPLNNAHQFHFNCPFSVTMAGSSPHKPRRKVKKSSNGSEVSTVSSATARSVTVKPTYPLAAFLWPARSSVSQWEILPLVLMAVGLFRWAAGLWGYSGMFWPTM